MNEWILHHSDFLLDVLSLTVSISLRYSSNVLLSLISPDAIQLLIWSRNLCNFLISFLRSASYFSFWLLFVALCTFCQMSSNVSTPSVTFLRHRSISPERLWNSSSYKYYIKLLLIQLLVMTLCQTYMYVTFSVSKQCLKNINTQCFILIL